MALAGKKIQGKASKKQTGSKTELDVPPLQTPSSPPLVLSRAEHTVCIAAVGMEADKDV